MDHADHVNLLRPAGLAAGGTWADLGAGTGAFTLALRELVGAEANIHAVDKDRSALNELAAAFEAMFGEAANLHLVAGDFMRPRGLPPLDGVVMANSLHFHRDHVGVLKHVSALLKPGGQLLLVEYNVDHGNPWVPHPISFASLKSIAASAGFNEPRLLGRVPSGFLHEIYSALLMKQQGGR